MTAPAYAAPLRAVDRLDIATGDDGALVVRATKVVSVADPYLEGHFPAVTVYPGVFLLETVRQAVLGALATDGGAPLPRLTVIRSMRCMAALRAGDVVRLEIELRPVAGARWDHGALRAKAVALRGDGVRAATLHVEVEQPVVDRG